MLLIDALDRAIKAIQIFFKKVLKSPFRFKPNFRRFKILLNVFTETFLVFCSFIKEIFFFNNIVKWLIQWRNLIRLVMKESLSLTYALYFILLGLFGILVGFLLGLYRRLLGKDEIDQIYLFWLLLFLHLLSQKEFEDTLLRNLSDSYRVYRAANIAEPFEKFSFEPLPQIESRPFKLILKEPEKIPQIPFPILNDPSVNVEIDFILYKF